MKLMIVDMLEGFTRTGVLASPRIAALIPAQVEFIKQMPDPSYVLFACDSHMPDDAEFRRMPVHCMKGSPEAVICPEILNAVLERGFTYDIVEKSTHSAFFNTNCDALFDSYGFEPDNWIMFGCVTDICIAANVMELDYRGNEITLVRDLIDTYDIPKNVAETVLLDPTKFHDPNVINPLFFDYYLPGVWGAKVKTASEVIEDWHRLMDEIRNSPDLDAELN